MPSFRAVFQAVRDNEIATRSLGIDTTRANVTTGAFYYHFESKEAVAVTLVNEGWPKAVVVIKECMDELEVKLNKIFDDALKEKEPEKVYLLYKKNKTIESLQHNKTKKNNPFFIDCLNPTKNIK